MATNLLPPSATFTVRASADTRKTSTAGTSTTTAGSKWWTPLFGWSSDADYIDSKPAEPVKMSTNKKVNQQQNQTRFNPGCFTEEKAKQLRMMTKETASFHDVMYHSAIASRLASDFSRRDD